jgi:glycosyltransferase involved in cell wall biosynthesis
VRIRPAYLSARRHARRFDRRGWELQMTTKLHKRPGADPLVSVAIAAYNAERYIGDAIESIIGQSFEDWELIIIDDGSTDGTQGRIQSIGDSRVKSFRQEHQGLSVARNRSLTESRGRYFAILDADDVSYPDRLKRQVAAYESAGPRILFGEADFIDAASQPLKGGFKARPLTRGQILHYFFTVGNFLCMPTVFSERKIFLEAGPFDCSIFYLQDFDMWTRLVKKYELNILPGPVTQYRVHENSLTGPRREPDLERDVILRNEKHGILRRLFDGVSPELFHEAFGSMVIRPGCASELELRCEQAFLYLNLPNKAHKFIGIEKLAALLNEQQARALLKEQYGFTTLSFLEATKQADIANIVDLRRAADLQQELLREKEQAEAAGQRVIEKTGAALQIKDAQLRASEEQLRAILQSRSWRIGAPFRFMKTKLSQFLAGTRPSRQPPPGKS